MFVCSNTCNKRSCWNSLPHSIKHATSAQAKFLSAAIITPVEHFYCVYSKKKKKKKKKIGIVFPTLCYAILTWEIHNRNLDPLTVIPLVSFATYATSYIRKVT